MRMAAATARAAARSIGSTARPSGGTGHADVAGPSGVKSHFAVRPPVAQHTAARAARAYPLRRSLRPSSVVFACIWVRMPPSRLVGAIALAQYTP
jgi:hypothetical protein